MYIPTITIIGFGRLGRALSRGVLQTEFTLKSTFAGRSKPPRGGSEISGVFPSGKEALGKLVFLSVSDSAISEVARRLAALDNDYSSYTFVHCSGNEPASRLEALRLKGARIAAFHPLQTFNQKSGPADFKDIYFSLQGDPKAFPALRQLAEALGGQAVEVTLEQKERLHAAAVMASNYLITLLDAAIDIGAEGGLSRPQVKQALLPLVQTTLDNARTAPLREVLTGPVVRGDADTIANHMRILENKPEARQLYAALGKHTVELARSAENLEAGKVQKIMEALSR